jgi:hypothetical protein
MAESPAKYIICCDRIQTRKIGLHFTRDEVVGVREGTADFAGVYPRNSRAGKSE